MYRSVIILCCSSKETVTSRKLTCEVELSASNLMLGKQLLRWLTKACRLSSPCVQMINISSMNRFQTKGAGLYVYTYLSSNQPMKVLA